MARPLIELTPQTADDVMCGRCRFEHNGIRLAVDIQKRRGRYYRYLVTKYDRRIYKSYIQRDNRYMPYEALIKAARDILKKIETQAAL